MNSSSAIESDREYSGSVLWIVINALLIFLIVAGNCLTIVAILLCRRLSSLVSNQFVFSLAVSDLLVGLSIPYHMAFYIIDDFGMNRPTCLIRFVLLTFACASSVWNLLLIAADRYIAIVYPLHYVRFMTRKVSVLMIAIIWIVSFTMANILFKWNNYDEALQCEVVYILPNDYMNYIVTPMFVAVWLIIFLLYTRICREASGQSKRLRKGFQAMQVILTIFGCFTICWLPFFIETLYARITRDSRVNFFYEISFTLAVSNSGMNPIIYAWKNSSFRKAFLALIKCQSPNNTTSNHFVTNHVPSKKNSINGLCNGTEEDLTKSEVIIEMKRQKHKKSEIANVHHCTRG